MEIKKATALKGELNIPGDKSISHRAVMLGSISEGLTEVRNFLEGADCLATIACFQKMGIPIEQKKDVLQIRGKGMSGLTEPSGILDTGNSGTTMRLISGLLAAQNFQTTLTGDASIQSRPMKRIIAPLSAMGADIQSLRGNGCAPLKIHGTALKGIHYRSPVASAQVKSAILLAGLYAEGETSVTEPYLSRNHTEQMLRSFGAKVSTEDTTVKITACAKLNGQQVNIPGDISSAAYFIAAALLVPGSEVLIRNVGINDTRAGILKVCQEMGGNIELLNTSRHSAEPTADLLIKHSSLHGITIGGELIPTLIDELPIIAVLACFAKGTTVVKNAEELKVKESNRIQAIVENLSKMNADVTETPDGMIIKGGPQLIGSQIESHMDHRIAMSFAVAGLAAEGVTTITDSNCVNISYPDFYDTLFTLLT